MRLKRESDLVDINRHISTKVAGDILRVVGEPLGKDTIPHPRDLTHWWSKVERALEALNPRVSLQAIDARGCGNVAPIVLGDTAW